MIVLDVADWIRIVIVESWSASLETAILLHIGDVITSVDSLTLSDTVTAAVAALCSCSFHVSIIIVVIVVIKAAEASSVCIVAHFKYKSCSLFVESAGRPSSS